MDFVPCTLLNFTHRMAVNCYLIGCFKRRSVISGSCFILWRILTDGIDGTAHLWTKNGISSSTRKRIAIPAGSTLVDVPDNNLNSLSRYALAIGINSPLYLLPSLTNVPVIDSGCTEDAYFVSEEKRSEQTLVREGRDNLSCSRKFLCCGGPSGHFHLQEVGRSSS